jgi:hypothetical protein
LIVKKALSFVAAIAAMAAAAATCVVAAAYALYALLRYYLGPAGAAAVIAIVFAAVTVTLAVITFRKTQPQATRRDEQSLTTRLIDLAREKPIIAAGAAAAAGLVLLRNPRVVGAAVSAAMASRAREAEREDRRGHKHKR